MPCVAVVITVAVLIFLNADFQNVEMVLRLSLNKLRKRV